MEHQQQRRHQELSRGLLPQLQGAVCGIFWVAPHPSPLMGVLTSHPKLDKECLGKEPLCAENSGTRVRVVASGGWEEFCFPTSLWCFLLGKAGCRETGTLPFLGRLAWAIGLANQVTSEVCNEFTSKLVPAVMKSQSPKKFQLWGLENCFAKGGLSTLHAKKACEGSLLGIRQRIRRKWPSLMPLVPARRPSCPLRVVSWFPLGWRGGTQ